MFNNFFEVFKANDKFKLPPWYEEDILSFQDYYNGRRVLDLCGKDYSFAGGEPFARDWLIQMRMLSETFLPGYVPSYLYKSGDDVSAIFNRLAEILATQLKVRNIDLENKLRDEYLITKLSSKYFTDRPTPVMFDTEYIIKAGRCGNCWLIDNPNIATSLEPMFFGIAFPGWLDDFMNNNKMYYPDSILILGLETQNYCGKKLAVQIYRDSYNNKLVIDTCDITMPLDKNYLIPTVMC